MLHPAVAIAALGMLNCPPQSHESSPSDPGLSRWSERVIGAAIAVHRGLGPGLLESAYSAALAVEFGHRRIPYEREVVLPVRWRGVELDARYRLDFLIANSLVLEVKALERLLPIHEAQLLTYLKLGGYRIGLLLNFCAPLLRDGIVRRIL